MLWGRGSCHSQAPSPPDPHSLPPGCPASAPLLSLRGPPRLPVDWAPSHFPSETQLLFSRKDLGGFFPRLFHLLENFLLFLLEYDCFTMLRRLRVGRHPLRLEPSSTTPHPTHRDAHGAPSWAPGATHGNFALAVCVTRGSACVSITRGSACVSMTRSHFMPPTPHTHSSILLSVSLFLP